MQNIVPYCIFRKKNSSLYFLSTTDILKSSCVNREWVLQVKALTTQSWQPEFNSLNHEKCQIHWIVSANPDSKKGGRERKMPWRLEDQLAWCTLQKGNNRDPSSNKADGNKWQSRWSSTRLLSHRSTCIQKFVHTGTHYSYTNKNFKKTHKIILMWW